MSLSIRRIDAADATACGSDLPRRISWHRDTARLPARQEVHGTYRGGERRAAMKTEAALVAEHAGAISGPAAGAALPSIPY